jgi:hypothetical protein
MRAFRRIARAAILQDLCPKSMGVSVKIYFSHGEFVLTPKFTGIGSMEDLYGYSEYDRGGFT